MKLENKDFPGLYRAASKASQEAQNIYYRTLITYIVLLIAASAVSFYWNSNVYGSIVSASLFLITLGLLIFLKTNQPEKKWYNDEPSQSLLKRELGDGV